MKPNLKASINSLKHSEIFNNSQSLEITLRDYLKVKRKRIWAKRFVVVDAGSLYYFKTPASVQPRFFLKLDGAQLLNLGLQKGHFQLQVAKDGARLKLAFQTEATQRLWLDTLEANLNPLRSEEGDVGDPAQETQVRLTPIPSNLSVEELTNRQFSLAGSRGGCRFYSEQTPRRASQVQLVAAYLIISLFSVPLASLIILGYLALFYYRRRQVPFKCTASVSRGISSIIKTMADWANRHEWDPYVESASENRLNYTRAALQAAQYGQQREQHYLIAETLQGSLRSVFKLEDRHSFTLVTHYGKAHPTQGSKELLACLKLYIESQQPSAVKPESDDDDQPEMKATEDSQASQWTHDASTIMSEVLKVNKEPGWEAYKLKDPLMQASKRKAPGGLLMIRGVGEVPRRPTDIIEYLKELEHKHDYDEMFESGHQIQAVDPDMEVVYLKYKKQTGVTPRDFCLLQKRFFLDDGSIVGVAMSIEHPDCPPTQFVRAHLFLGCFIIEPLDESRARLTYIVHADIKGNIPKFIVNGVQEKQAYVVTKIRNALVV